ncbi:hypothetical protein ACFL6P_09375 [Candidatus Latescibacterota bacterium]
MMLILSLFWFAGCGSMFRAEAPFQGTIPKTNSHVAEIVVRSALENAGIPVGRGAEVRFSMDSSGDAHDIMAIAGPEFLLDHGYTVSESPGTNESIPEFRFGIDTLYVNLDRDKNVPRTIGRIAAANIRAVLAGSGDVESAGSTGDARGTGGAKKVFIGAAKYSDSFPAQMMEATGTEEPYINRFPSREHIKSMTQPLLLGITMTALVWLLYSYRG